MKLNSINLKPSPSASPLRSNGFALVVTLSLMILLTIIAVGLLTLSSISLRTASQGEAMATARGNARLALMLAIGDLQKSLGPDQRISASSNILDTLPLTPEIDGVGLRHVAGAWKSWKWKPGDPNPTYATRKTDDFIQWLTSAPKDTDLKKRDYVTSATGTVKMVASGTSDVATDYVNATPISLTDKNGSANGALAWTVFDESQKARVSLPNEPLVTDAERINGQSAPALPGFETITEWKELADANTETQAKFLTLETMNIKGILGANFSTKKLSMFHALSPYCANVMSNVGEGGLAKDLSLLLNQGSLPSDFTGKYLYSGTTTPIAPAPKRFTKAGLMPSPDPTWKLLHSHFNMYKRVSVSSGAYSVKASEIPRPASGGDPLDPFFTEQQILPVVSKAQFVYSISASWHPVMGTDPAKPANWVGAGNKYITWLVTDPVITLWNPYNVDLKFKETQISLYRMPLRLTFYKNGTKISQSATHVGNTLTDNGTNADFAQRMDKYYRLNLIPKEGETEIVMKPGQHLVFTAHTNIGHFNVKFWDKGVFLRPGWTQPIGKNSSTSNIGGISTLNMMIDEAGNNSGYVGVAALKPTIPCKAGDKIGVAVEAGFIAGSVYPEGDGKDLTAFMKFYQGTSPEGTLKGDKLIGGIELKYSAAQISKNLRSYGPTELHAFEVTSDIPEGFKGDNTGWNAKWNGTKLTGNETAELAKYKQPFLIATLNLKTELNSKDPSKPWLQNSPTNTYASSGIDGDQTEISNAQQYELSWEPMTGWTQIPGIQIDGEGNGYGSSGLYADKGTKVTPFAGLPIVPPSSMGQLSHAPLNTGGQLPLTTQIVSNSFASPLLSRTEAQTDGPVGKYLDHSFLANSALYDNYFFSSATEQQSPIYGSKKRSLNNVISEFFDGTKRLPNIRFEPIPTGKSEITSLATANDAYKKMASHILLAGAFNVNSTSLEAWKVFLASGTEESIRILDAFTSTLTDSTDSGAIAIGGVVARMTPPTGDNFKKAKGQGLDKENEARWTGFRRLNVAHINALATQCVSQVKQRGPFQSTAEFVNRRLEQSELGLAGALQTAIQKCGINKDQVGYGLNLTSSSGYKDNPAADGYTALGSFATITQADILRTLAPYVAVRSDTFRVRAYGEAKSGSGTVVRAWCEAIVQRYPDYVDTTDKAEDPVSGVNIVNKTFGRRMKIVKFSWLSANEI